MISNGSCHFQNPKLSAILTTPVVDWKPEHIVASSWLQHIPFAFWAIKAVRPACLIELGTHGGASYFAFCQAVLRLGTPTRCFAVDTWLGDNQAGHYGTEIFESVNATNQNKYSQFSSLMQMHFDEARTYFSDGEIDILHIDGLHTYDAVSHDFNTWKSALSKRGVVFFHDINVRENEFGVWKFWSEIAKQYPHFEFHHGSGLGVAAVGDDVPEEISNLCSFSDRDAVAAAHIRSFFSARGEAILNLYQVEHSNLQIVQMFTEKEKAALENRRLAAEIQKLKYKEAELEGLYSSLSWRITAPLRLARSIAVKAKYQYLPRLKRALEARVLRLSRMVCKRPQTVASTLAPSPEVARGVVWVGGEPDTPGYQYRVVMPAAAARAAGINASCCRIDAVDAHLEDLASAGVIILWRTAWDDAVSKIFRIAGKNGAVVCLDLDDLMFDCRLATVKVIDGIRTQSLEESQVQEFYARINRTMDAADWCIATTPELAGHMRAFGKPAWVLPNGFDEVKFQITRLAVRRRRAAQDDGLVRIGYAGGSKTHQRDFSLCASALASVLRQFENARLVLFQSSEGIPIIDLGEFPDFLGLEGRIEWRHLVPFTELPNELARFDINLAPVEVGNLFCEAKSELKFFEAALADVCTIASPTGAFRRAIRHGETGMLAADDTEWNQALVDLLSDPEKRQRMAKQALREVLWPYSPERRAAMLESLLEQSRGGRFAAKAFALDVRLAQEKQRPLDIPAADIVFEHDRLQSSWVTVVVPLYNYSAYIIDALDSVAAQTEVDLDLVVVDDASTDNSLELAVAWAQKHANRFNRLVVLRNHQNSKLALTRNAGFDAAETPYVLPLDADNLLLPPCVSTCLQTLRKTGAAFVYPRIRTFGKKRFIMGGFDYAPNRFTGGNYIDAMALVPKSVWSGVGGYEKLPGHVPPGWEDYSFWCRVVEMGLSGRSAGEAVLAQYRVHGQSMLATDTMVPEKFRELVAFIQDRHPWLKIATDEVGKNLGEK